MIKGEKNFIESKDTLNFDVRTNMLFYITLLICFAVDILPYILKFTFKSMQGTDFNFIFAICIAALIILNVFMRIALRREKYQYMYYGVLLILISLYLNHLAIEVGLYPFNQLYGFVAIIVWVISSIGFIYSITDNIKNDRYSQTSNSIYYFKNQTDDYDGKKYGIVITKYSFVIGIVYVILAIALIILYFVKKDLFEESGKILMDSSQVGLIVFLLAFSYIANYGWKLVIKQVFINKSKA